MTGRDPEKMLRQEARRFPIIAELLERVAYLTDEEINTAVVPLPWYRVALRQLRDREEFKVRYESMKDNMEQGSGAFRHGRNPSINGRQGLFAQQDRWVMMFQTELLLREGTLVFFPNTGGIWVESAFGPKAPADSIMAGCRNIVETDLDSYKSAFNQRQASYHSDAPMCFDLAATPQGQAAGPSPFLTSLGVKFS